MILLLCYFSCCYICCCYFSCYLVVDDRQKRQNQILNYSRFNIQLLKDSAVFSNIILFRMQHIQTNLKCKYMFAVSAIFPQLFFFVSSLFPHTNLDNQSFRNARIFIFLNISIFSLCHIVKYRYMLITVALPT